MRVLTVIGTRPEAIKMAPVVRRLRETPGVEHVLGVTAQHRAMLDQALRLFDLVPDHDLDLMRPDQGLAAFAARALAATSELIAEVRPDWVLVQGDTTTAAAAAMAAFYGGARVGHVEAGLRSHDKRQPFPEEVNRRIAGVVADLHFAPTAGARENLLREGVAPDSVTVTGNPVVDALRMVAGRDPDLRCGPLADLPWDRRIVLVTAHRRENFGAPLREACLALRDVAAAHRGDVHIVYPVHPNPNVRGPVTEVLGGVDGVTLLEPLDYLPLVQVMERSYLVVTDSGGIQEEAPSLGKPVLVLRDVTERPEAVAAETVRLVGTDRSRLVAEIERLLGDPAAYRKMAQAVNPYGDGRAASRIADLLLGRPVVPFAPGG